jgi:hypothetical protein
MKLKVLFFTALVLLCLGAVFAQSENVDSNADQDQAEVFDHRLVVCDIDDKLLFELVEIKDILLIWPDNEDEVKLISWETSTGIDYIVVHANNSSVGIYSEYAWAYYTYPAFERQSQSLLFIKINGISVPCDLVHFKNYETGETKEIYFEISDFFGKW